MQIGSRARRLDVRSGDQMNDCHESSSNWRQAVYTTSPTVGTGNLVTALFADRVLSFNMSNDATFEDLADRLDRLADWRTGMPKMVNLKLPKIR